MRIRLLTTKYIEINGKMKRVGKGEIVDIGKGSARSWIASGDAGNFDPEIRSGWMYRSSDMLNGFRDHWYSNSGEGYSVGNSNYPYSVLWEKGGPSPEFNDCQICQESEWSSRLEGLNRYTPHSCPSTKICYKQCCTQANQEEYPHHSQDFLFAASVDDRHNAPGGLMLQNSKGVNHMYSRSADQGRLIFLRQFAVATQYDMVGEGRVPPRDVSSYDFIYIFCSGGGYNSFRWDPSMPILMYGHDMWKRPQERQNMIDMAQPDIFWTPYYSSWKTHYTFPRKTRVEFRPLMATNYFTRPNVDGEKRFDLLMIGSCSNPIYGPRIALRDKLEKLNRKDMVVHIHDRAGASRANHEGATGAGPMPFLTAWSEFLGSARYVIFDGISQEPQPLFFKYYEALGSGAVPIFPSAPDLELLGVEPYRHYIPIEEYRNDMDGLIKLVHKDNSHIARNAVSWFRENSDKMMLDRFEDMIHSLVKGKYPKRARPK